MSACRGWSALRWERLYPTSLCQLPHCLNERVEPQNEAGEVSACRTQGWKKMEDAGRHPGLHVTEYMKRDKEGFRR